MLWATPTQDQHLYSAYGRARFEHGLVTRLAGAAGRTRRNRLPPAESTEPAWEAERPAPVGLAQGLGIYQVIIAGAVAS